MEVSKLPDAPLWCRIVFPLLLFSLQKSDLVTQGLSSPYYKHTHVSQNDLHLLPKRLLLANPFKKIYEDYIEDDTFFSAVNYVHVSLYKLTSWRVWKNHSKPVYILSSQMDREKWKSHTHILIHWHFNAGLLSLFQTCHEAIYWNLMYTLLCWYSGW